MPTIHTQSIIEVDGNLSSGDFILDPSRLPTTGASSWSVRKTTLRGGIQEGVEMVLIDNGRLHFAVLPTRGMGILKAEMGDLRLGWDSPVRDPVHPAFIRPEERGGLGWLSGFNEWIVRCGLGSMGAPGQDVRIDEAGKTKEEFLTLHGRIANLPARRVALEIDGEAIVLRGEVDEASFFGPFLRLNTEIRTSFGSNALTIRDTVTNLGGAVAEHQLLYHINYGDPLLEAGARLVLPYRQAVPRDRRAAEGIENFAVCGGPEAGFAEQVYFFEAVGQRGSRQTLAMLRNARGNRASVLRYSLRDFPCFTFWKNTGARDDGYVVGLEPATAFPNARQFERSKGRVIELQGGESRTTTLTVEALDTRAAVRRAEAEIRALGKGVNPRVIPEPVARFSDG